MKQFSIRPLKPWERKAIALFLVLLCLAGVVLAFAWPTYWLHQRYDQQLDEVTRRITAYRRVSAMRPDIEQAMDKLSKWDSKKLYLKSSNPSRAAAELQDMVKQLVESKGGRLLSVQIVPPKDEGSHRRIGLNIQVAGSLIVIQQVLYGVTQKEPYLFLDTFSLRGTVRNYRPQPGVEPELSGQLVIYGYTMVDEGS